jgi:hypothetical protein
MHVTSVANCTMGLIGVLAFVVSSYAADQPQIGSGQPGLKIATRAPGSIVIYEDEPSTVGAGLAGGMATRKIRVLIDQNYHFSKERMEIPEQLYPLEPDAVFTSSGGTWTEDFHRWEYTARTYAGYRARGSEVDFIPDIQAAARKLYSLARMMCFWAHSTISSSSGAPSILRKCTGGVWVTMPCLRHHCLGM